MKHVRANAGTETLPDELGQGIGVLGHYVASEVGAAYTGLHRFLERPGSTDGR